ncbi:MAG: hypothetical protein J5848_02325 [Bacteroidales bacterium]|nr:hypothetical protein [Bacteroidales bacterium]
MKKANNFTLFILFISMFSVAEAQFSVGLRPSLSNYGGYDDRRRAEISVITGTIGEKSRFEFDFGWGKRQVFYPVNTTSATGETTVQYIQSNTQWGSATVLYQWHHKIFWNLYYYAGVGSSAFFTKNSLDILGVDVLLGLEIKMKLPLQVTLDYRPMLDVLDGLAYYHTIGLGVRYQFRPPEPEPEPTFIQRWKKKILGD